MMQYARPSTLTLGLAAMLIAAPAFGQASPPPQRGQQPPRPATGDTMAMMRERMGDMRDGMQGRQGGPPPGDFGRFLFPPELVMQHQRDIALTDAQRTVITGAIQKLESDVVAWQWKMTDEQQKLSEMVQATPVDSTATLAQIDKVLDLERQIKKAHIAMLVRVKNALTADQQHALRQFENRQPVGPSGGGGGRGRMGPPGGGGGRGRQGGEGGGAPPDGH